MSSNFDFDVIIVGGGPAGVSSAISIAKNGFKVVIIDKKKRNDIGEKTCGDAIDKAALMRVKDKIGIELPFENEISDVISKMSIAANDIDTKVSLDAPGYQIKRLEYGQRLLKEAFDLGVVIIPNSPVRGIIYENGYINGVTYYENSIKKELRAKFTIDASGAYAVIRKSLPDELLVDGMTKSLSDDQVWPTYREIIKLRDDKKSHNFKEEIVLMFDDDYPPPGYFWIFSEGEGYLNIGIGWEKTQNLGKLKDKLRFELGKYYKREDYEIIKKGGGQIPFRPPFDSLVFNGGALAGDAACMVHPVTAEGHGPALDTGVNLGLTISNALKNDRRDKESIWDYNLSVAKHYGRKHMEAHMMKLMLRNIGGNGLKFLIKRDILSDEQLNLIFAGEELGDAVTNYELIKKIIKLLYKPKLLWELVKLIKGLRKVDEIYLEYPIESIELKNWRRKRNSLLGVKF
ncbi:MAG: NAD(P)/FAD-dependent oxidoreductase [Candidatus Kariarchaeum pelagius]